MTDENKNNEFYAEVNWNEKDANSNECKLVKFTFPNGESCLIRRDILMSILWTMGTPEQQRKMIPQTLSKIRWYETVLSVRAKNDIHKGQLITFPVKLSLPPIEEEIIRDLSQTQTFKKKMG